MGNDRFLGRPHFFILTLHGGAQLRKIGFIAGSPPQRRQLVRAGIENLLARWGEETS